MRSGIRMLLCWFASGVVLAGPPGTTTADEALRIVYENYPPYEYQDGGVATGVNVAIVRAICARLSLQPSFESQPWKRALHIVQEGQADAIMSLFKTKERERFLAFPDRGLSIEKNILITSRQHPKAVRTWDDLRGLSVGVVAGNSYGNRFDHADWINKQPVTGSELLLRKQANLRTDVAASNEWVARYLIHQLQLEDQIELLDFVVSEEPLFIAFSKAKGEISDQRARQFSTALRELQEEGVIAKLIQEHGLTQLGPGPPQP